MRTPHAVRTTLSSQEKENDVNNIQRYYVQFPVRLICGGRNLRFSPFYYSYSTPLREVRCFPQTPQINRTGNCRVKKTPTKKALRCRIHLFSQNIFLCRPSSANNDKEVIIWDGAPLFLDLYGSSPPPYLAVGGI